MAELRNDLIQSAMVAYLKTKTTVLAELSDTSEIREDQWQGITFVYPCIRVNMTANRPIEYCNVSNIELTVQVFSEQSSSAQADKIAGIIKTVLHAKSFSQSGYNVSLRCTDLVPARRIEEKAWRSDVMLAGMVSG
jgi:hypothetical protein